MKQVTFKNSRSQTLVGNLYTANSKSIVILSHGFTGDKSEWGHFDRVAEALSEVNYNALAFDFSGCGESDDDTLTVAKQVDDLSSAIEYAKSLGYQKIGLFGHSLGGLIALKNHDKGIETMVLTAPVTDKVKYDWSERYTKGQLDELKDQGYLTKVRDEGVRNTFLIDKRMLKDRESVNQKEILENVKCPVLIIHGNKDESVPVEDSINAIKQLSPDSRLEVIDGMDHYMKEEYDEVVDKTLRWFQDHLEH